MSVTYQPEDFARALLARFDVRHPVNLYDLAGRLGLSIREVDSRGFEGALVRQPGRLRGIIAVRRDIREETRKRFTISHELGHAILIDHGAFVSVCADADIECLLDSTAGQEEEANRFASELLLPSALVAPIVRRRSARISTAKIVGRQFVTSLTAAAAKCVEVADEACALVVSTDAVITKFKPNHLWRFPISLGQSLAYDTLARHLSDDSDARENVGIVPARAWLDAPLPCSGVYMQEDSILLPYYGKVLSILTASSPEA